MMINPTSTNNAIAPARVQGLQKDTDSTTDMAKSVSSVPADTLNDAASSGTANYLAAEARVVTETDKSAESQLRRSTDAESNEARQFQAVDLFV
jgi:hypothetical protein